MGHYTVRPGQVAYINDTSLFSKQDTSQQVPHPEVLLRFFINAIGADFHAGTSGNADALLVGNTARFGADVFSRTSSNGRPLRFSQTDGIAVFRDLMNPDGCTPYSRLYTDVVIVVERGGCTFLQKLRLAQAASAGGVVVLSNDDIAVNPSANADEIEEAGDMSDVCLVLLPRTPGHIVRQMMDSAEREGFQVLMVVEDIPHPSHTPPEKDPSRILYINGYPLVNTRLLV